MTTLNHFHAGQPVLQTGATLSEAKAAVILIHGRGASAEDILSLADDLRQPGIAFLAPQARGYTWYPQRFIAPLESNEPYLSSALTVLSELRENLSQQGIAAQRTLWVGFSQGACLALEFAIRGGVRLGGVGALSGGLIGPEGTQWPRPIVLSGMPVLLGCDAQDFHIPLQRVRDSAQIFREIGAVVSERIYDDLGHAVNEDEINKLREMLRVLLD